MRPLPSAFPVFIGMTPTGHAGHILFSTCRGSLLPLLSCACILILASQRAHAILDTNHNGISDIWEIKHNSEALFPETFDPQADPDSDGWTNAMEAVAGTDPFDPTPPNGCFHPSISIAPAVFSAPDENGNPQVVTRDSVTFTWPTVAGKQYALLSATNLEDEIWQPVDNPFISFGTEAYFWIPPIRSEDSPPENQFWRVAVSDIDSDGDDLADNEEDELGTSPIEATTVSGLPDLWLATHFLPTLLHGGIRTIDPNDDLDGDGRSTREEFLDGTDPNIMDTVTPRRWVAVTGSGAQGRPLTRTGRLTIPAGQSATLMIALASDEFPYWTGDLSEFNDLLEWNIRLSHGPSIQGSIDVNLRHLDWEIDLTNQVSLLGFPSPTHFEEIQTLTASDEDDLTIDITVSATNISDDQLPSHIAIGIVMSE